MCFGLGDWDWGFLQFHVNMGSITSVNIKLVMQWTIAVWWHAYIHVYIYVKYEVSLTVM